MSRFHYWQFLINSEGQPIPDANISVYIAGTDSPANVYYDEFGSNHSNQNPQVITNNVGYFEFWVGDSSEEYGYQKGQKFKLEWEKPGVALGEIDWIDVFPQVVEVDENDFTSSTKNKVISNKLAYRWEEHRNHTIQDNGFPIHGIETINEYDSDAFPNKLISNAIGKKWNEHSNYSFLTTPLSASVSPAHDLTPIDRTLTDDIYNKLISNKILYDLDGDIASIYNNLDLINAKIVEMGNAGNIFIPHSLSDTWTLDHNFGVKYVSVTIYGTDDNEIEPKNVTLTNMNTVTVSFEFPVSGYAVITGNVIEGGPETPPFIIEGDHGSLTGLLGDDHTQYILVDGSRGFTNTISGIAPISSGDLTTKEYVDNITIAHSRLSESSYGDDHSQYIHIDGRRGFRNPIKGKNPIEYDHLVTKMYVDEHIFSHNTLIDTDYDNHLQYIHMDGRRGFTHNISGIIPVEPSHLVTKEYVDQHYIAKFDTTITTWDADVNGWSKVITHNLSSHFPVVMVWDTTIRKVISPSNIESIDDNNIKITVSDNNETLIKVRT